MTTDYCVLFAMTTDYCVFSTGARNDISSASRTVERGVKAKPAMEEDSAFSEDSTGPDLGPTAVVDFGSERTRAGFSPQDRPSVSVPSVVGRPRVVGLMASSGSAERSREAQKEVFVGDDILSRRDVLTCKYPSEWGSVTNWDDFQVLWEYVLRQKLGCNPEVSPLVVVESCSMNPKVNREKMTLVAFEEHRVPLFYLSPAAPAVLRAAGRRTGLMIDISKDATRVVPVYEGYQLPHAIMKSTFGGSSLTYHLHAMLERAGFSKLGFKELKAMKEELAYVAQDYQQEKDTFSLTQEKTFQLPGGDVVKLGPERFQCAEPIFQPGLMGEEMPGLPDHVLRTVYRCDGDIRQTLLSNVVLAGGGSLLPGLASRLQNELETGLRDWSDMRALSSRVQVVAPPDRDLLAWKGGSLLAASPEFTDMCISLDEYDEYGPSLVHRKCF